MAIAQNRAYIKPAMMTLLTSQCVPMVAITESKFLSVIWKLNGFNVQRNLTFTD